MPHESVRSRLSVLVMALSFWLGAGVAGVPAQEAEGAAARFLFEIDPAASKVTFELGATLHAVEGTAEITSGSVRFDPARGSASGRIVVDARSLETGNDRRDEDMHTKVLESIRFPQIYLEIERMSGAFDPAGEGQITVDARFGIHGAEHPVSLIFDVRSKEGTLEASTEFRLPYVEWGMKDPSKFVLRVDKQVTVAITAVGALSRVDSGANPDGDGESDPPSGIEPSQL